MPDEAKNDGTRPPEPIGPNELRACWCTRCLDAPDLGLKNPVRMRMIVCPACGNKRCPRATDHRFACTGSNEPGQFGSDYGAPVDDARERFVIVDWLRRSADAIANGEHLGEAALAEPTTTPTHDHPWGDFLHHRARALRWLRDEMGETPEKTAATMRMNPAQVRLILMTVDSDPKAYGF